MRESFASPATNSRHLPALTQNTPLRYFNFMVLYIAQGIPEGMWLFGIPAWMAMNGKTPGEIGSFVAVCGLPWSFKIIVAPMMDRFFYLPMGRKRPWVLFGQLGLILSFLAMAFIPDPLNNLSLLMAAGFAVGFFGAFQDVATDGMAIDIIPQQQQARANGFMWGAKIMGTAASLAIGTWLLNQYGFRTALSMLSMVVVIIMLVPIFVRERPGEKLLPWTKGVPSSNNHLPKANSWKEIFTSLYKVFTLRYSLFFALFMFSATAAFNYLDTIMSIFAVKGLGWTNQEYANFYSTANFVGGIGGMFLGGILIDKFGKVRMLNIYILLLITLLSIFSFSKSAWTNSWFISGFMICFQILYVFTNIGMFAIAMQCCWKKVSATQFTLYMTISNIGRLAGAALIGPVTSKFSWQYTLFAFVILIASAWIILQFIYISRHVKSVNKIEAAELPSFSPALP